MISVILFCLDSKAKCIIYKIDMLLVAMFEVVAF